MISNKCLVCGSYSMRADRALSGRLVCNSCGTPLGVRRPGNNKINKFNVFSFKKCVELSLKHQKSKISKSLCLTISNGQGLRWIKVSYDLVIRDK